MSEAGRFTCQFCGREFDPDPAAVCEAVWERNVVPETEAGDELRREDLEAMDAEELRQSGLTPEMRDKLLAGEDVSGALIVCTECQDEALKEQERTDVE